MRNQFSSCLQRPASRRAIVQVVAFSLVSSSVSAVAAPSSSDTAEALRCEVERRHIEQRHRADLEDCRRLDAEAEARREPFDGRACEAGADDARRRALEGMVCAHDGSAAAESTGDAGGSLERGLATLPTGTREVTYSQVSGLAVLEGDIVLGRALRAAAKSDDDARADLAAPSSHAVTERALLWPQATVAYDISGSTPAVVRERILSAIDHWNTSTLMRLRPRSLDDQDVLLFYSEEATCWAEVGHQGGVQLAHLGIGCQRGNAIHEIGHAVGLLHEHTRHDRDDHVAIQWDHIDPAMQHNFAVVPVPRDAGSDPTPLSYDFRSVMHYGSYAFSIDGEPTVVRSNGATFVENREALSALDIGAVTSLVLTQAGSAPALLENQASQRCLSGGRSQAVEGQKTRVRTCVGRPEAQWHLYRDPHSGDELLVNERSRQCLSVPGASELEDVRPRTRPCDGGDAQRFEIRDRPDGSFELRSAVTGLCIGTVDAAGRQVGGVLQAECTGSPGQLWKRG